MEPLVKIPENHPAVSRGFSGPVWLDKNGLVYMIAGNEPEHSLEHAKSQIEAFEEVCGGTARPVLVDFTNMKAMSRPAREFYTGKGNMKRIKALAIVSGSKMGFFVANFFIGVNLQTEIPIRICNDVETAIAWLKQFKNA
ncbi:MAG: STAS/SEC14 domain-containing protein [Bacteroidia bacterium]|nr:STAS/SEC14 domain-containing protein [Bacteroidia bacterium]